MYYIKVEDTRYQEEFYLSYYTNDLNGFYYCLDKKNYNQAYSTTELLLKFNDYKDAENFIDELNGIRLLYENKNLTEYQSKFLDKLPLMLLVRNSIIFKVINESELGK